MPLSFFFFYLITEATECCVLPLMNPVHLWNDSIDVCAEFANRIPALTLKGRGIVSNADGPSYSWLWFYRAAVILGRVPFIYPRHHSTLRTERAFLTTAQSAKVIMGKMQGGDMADVFLSRTRIHLCLCSLASPSTPSVPGVAPTVLISTFQPYDMILTQIQAISIDHSYNITPRVIA